MLGIRQVSRGNREAAPSRHLDGSVGRVANTSRPRSKGQSVFVAFPFDLYWTLLLVHGNRIVQINTTETILHHLPPNEKNKTTVIDCIRSILIPGSFLALRALHKVPS